MTPFDHTSEELAAALPFPMSCTITRRDGRTDVSFTVFDPRDETVKTYAVAGAEGGTVTHRPGDADDIEELKRLRALLDAAIGDR